MECFSRKNHLTELTGVPLKGPGCTTERLVFERLTSSLLEFVGYLVFPLPRSIGVELFESTIMLLPETYVCRVRDMMRCEWPGSRYEVRHIYWASFLIVEPECFRTDSLALWVRKGACRGSVRQ